MDDFYLLLPFKYYFMTVSYGKKTRNNLKTKQPKWKTLFMANPVNIISLIITVLH